jgi:alpha-ketoglutarate-dependent taurine dioxygenase
LHKHRWRDGDVLFIDNHRFLHGRELMDGESERVIYSRFGYWS